MFPHRSDDVVVEPYNSVLTLKRLKHHADTVTVGTAIQVKHLCHEFQGFPSYIKAIEMVNSTMQHVCSGEPVERAHMPASVGRDTAASGSPPLAGDGRV